MLCNTEEVYEAHVKGKKHLRVGCYKGKVTMTEIASFSGLLKIRSGYEARQESALVL